MSGNVAPQSLHQYTQVVYDENEMYKCDAFAFCDVLKLFRSIKYFVNL